MHHIDRRVCCRQLRGNFEQLYDGWSAVGLARWLVRRSARSLRRRGGGAHGRVVAAQLADFSISYVRPICGSCCVHCSFLHVW